MWVRKLLANEADLSPSKLWTNGNFCTGPVNIWERTMHDFRPKSSEDSGNTPYGANNSSNSGASAVHRWGESEKDCKRIHFPFVMHISLECNLIFFLHPIQRISYTLLGKREKKQKMKPSSGRPRKDAWHKAHHKCFNFMQHGSSYSYLWLLALPHVLIH